MKESDLYEPIRCYLEGLGYEVRAEVKDCDVTATRGDDLVVVELKRVFGLRLVMQAVKRQRATPSVYVAIPKPRGGPFTRAWRDMCHLLRRLELGLIVVDNGSSSVELIFHPGPHERRSNASLRRSILREIDGRSGDYNTGGAAAGSVVTAYRESAVHVACCLEKYGPLSPTQLRKLGTSKNTQSVLYRNVYGWFDRVEKGVYALHDAGRSSLARYGELRKLYRGRLARKKVEPR